MSFNRMFNTFIFFSLLLFCIGQIYIYPNNMINPMNNNQNTPDQNNAYNQNPQNVQAQNNVNYPNQQNVPYQNNQNLPNGPIQNNLDNQIPQNAQVQNDIQNQNPQNEEEENYTGKKTQKKVGEIKKNKKFSKNDEEQNNLNNEMPQNSQIQGNETPQYDAQNNQNPQYDGQYNQNPQYAQDQNNPTQQNVPQQYNQYPQNVPQQYNQYPPGQYNQYPGQYNQYPQNAPVQYNQYPQQYNQYSQQENENNYDEKPKKNKKKEQNKTFQIKEIYNKAEVLLLGFDRYQYNPKYKKRGFHIYWVPIKERIYPKHANLTVFIQYKEKYNRLRNLEGGIYVHLFCAKRGSDNRNLHDFWCSFKPKTSIETIQILPHTFKPYGQKIKIKAISPFAAKYMYSVKRSPNKPTLCNPLYILNEAELTENITSFNITGKVREPEFYYDELNLLVSLTNQITQKKIRCDVLKVNKKYTISCTPSEDIRANLDGAFADLGGESLIVNFDDDEDSYINFNYKSPELLDIENNPSGSKRPIAIEMDPNVDEKISPITIIFVIITLVFVFGIGMAFFLKKQKSSSYDWNMDVVKFSSSS